MTNKSITYLIKGAPVLTPEDTIRRAQGLMAAIEGSSLLVIRFGQIVGSVNEQAIAGYLANAEDTDNVLQAQIGPIIESNIGAVMINSSATMRQAAELFSSTGVDMLPVIDNNGAYQGVLYRRDLLSRLTRNLRPPTIAGMATPLGVYLTSGTHSGGAGSFGLFLTGVSLGLMIIIASLAVDGLMGLFTVLTGVRLAAFLASTPLTTRLNLYDLPTYFSVVLSSGIMLLLLRLSPLAGYHAAEHMTVHAIEAGEELSPDVVAKMPRVHPRCGTNLMAAAAVFVILTSSVNNQFAVLVAIMVVVLGWRSIGGWLQQYVTTRTPNEYQIRNGIAAGEELLRKYQERPNYQLVGFQRIWKFGFIQTAAGMGTVMLIAELFEPYLHISLLG